MNVVGIVGKMGAGKDTIGLYLKDRHNFIPMSFASNVKEIGKILFNVEKKDKWGRFVYQQIGSLMRRIKKSVWIDALFRDIETIRDHDLSQGYDDPRFVITDTRYLNEAISIISKNSGHIIILNVPSEVRRKRCEKRDERKISEEEWEEASTHGSETGVDEIMKILGGHPNVYILTMSEDTSKVEMYRKVDEILHKCGYL